MPSTDAPSTGAGPIEADAVIETTALTKVYPGRVTALDGLTVSVEGAAVDGMCVTVPARDRPWHRPRG